jgi:Putative adhesin
MKKDILTLLFAVAITSTLFAQEYKIARSSGKLEIKEVNNITIEGSSGNEIIFSSMDRDRDDDDRSKGLRAVNALGLEDNTGIGLSVVDKGGSIQVYQLKKMDGPKVKIQVPKGVSVFYSHSSPYGSDVIFKNVEGEIEISTVHNDVRLENITGPMNVKTVHGDIEADFNAGLKGPISLTSVHGHVDVTIPAATKGTMNMSTTWGEIFVDPAIKLEIEPKTEWVKYGSGKINGKINGGGLDFTLSSTHNSIYLRKK